MHVPDSEVISLTAQRMVSPFLCICLLMQNGAQFSSWSLTGLWNPCFSHTAHLWSATLSLFLVKLNESAGWMVLCLCSPPKLPVKFPSSYLLVEFWLLVAFRLPVSWMPLEYQSLQHHTVVFIAFLCLSVSRLFCPLLFSGMCPFCSTLANVSLSV